jgi:LysR family hca operon transcriptional activator
MELQHRRCFVAVAEAESLTVAAERKRHTSQSSLGWQTWVLEDEVDAQLLTRRSRHRTVVGEALCKAWLRRRAH